MSSDLTRLNKWMRRTGYDSETLCAELGYMNNVVSQTVKAKKPVSRSFRRMFAKRFGEPLAFALFKEPIGWKTTHTGGDMHPERYEADCAVRLKCNNGAMFPAKDFLCHLCGKPAVHNHHPSYAVEHQLCVVALCRSCHVRVHTGSLKLKLRLVADPVGYFLAAGA